MHSHCCQVSKQNGSSTETCGIMETNSPSLLLPYFLLYIGSSITQLIYKLNPATGCVILNNIEDHYEQLLSHKVSKLQC